MGGKGRNNNKIALIIEYDGSNYYGFQLQESAPTIQGKMEEAIERLTGEPSRVMAASRTDTGVHAKGQVVSFQTKSSHPTQTFIDGLNFYLPRDIAVKASYRIGNAFNVRRDAISREYDYYIFNSPNRSPMKESYSYRVAISLNIEAMNQACQALVGEHDFASFATRNGARMENTVRTVYRAEVKRNGELVTFKMVANSFLPHQVRNTIGALIRVGLGKMGVDEFFSITEAKTPGLAKPTAPACGLCLMQINYPQPFKESIL